MIQLTSGSCPDIGDKLQVLFLPQQYLWTISLSCMTCKITSATTLDMKRIHFCHRNCLDAYGAVLFQHVRMKLQMLLCNFCNSFFCVCIICFNVLYFHFSYCHKQIDANILLWCQRYDGKSIHEFLQKTYPLQ